MRLNCGRLAVLVIFLSANIGVACGQNAVEQLQPLVETTAQRLLVAEQVALAKWDSGKAVEDAPREAQVIKAAVTAGEEKGLDEASVSRFFMAQIEANKFVQYGLLADWYRAGKAPAHVPVDLVKSIRPELDAVQKSLIQELVATREVRQSVACREDVAKAIGKYLSSHPQSKGSPITASTFDRALAGTCIRP